MGTRVGVAGTAVGAGVSVAGTAVGTRVGVAGAAVGAGVGVAGTAVGVGSGTAGPVQNGRQPARTTLTANATTTRVTRVAKCLRICFLIFGLCRNIGQAAEVL